MMSSKGALDAPSSASSPAARSDDAEDSATPRPISESSTAASTLDPKTMERSPKSPTGPPGPGTDIRKPKSEVALPPVAPEQQQQPNVDPPSYGQQFAAFLESGQSPASLLLQQATAAKAALGPLLVASEAVAVQLRQAREAAGSRTDSWAEGREREIRRLETQGQELSGQTERAKSRLDQLRHDTALLIGTKAASNALKYESAVAAEPERRALFTATANRLSNVGPLEKGAKVHVVADGLLKLAIVLRQEGGADSDWYSLSVHKAEKSGSGIEYEKRLRRDQIYASVELRQAVRGVDLPRTSIGFLLAVFRDAEDSDETLQQLGAAVCASVHQKLGADVVRAVHAPLKTTGRVMEKVAEKYEGDFSCICDLARMTFVCDTFEAATSLLEAVYVSSLVACVRSKDRLMLEFDANETGGYRDLLLNVRDPANGHIAEVQITLSSLLAIKTGGGHAEYKLARVLGLNKPDTFKAAGDVDKRVIEGVRCGLITDLSSSTGPPEELFSDFVAALSASTCMLSHLSLQGGIPASKKLADLLTPRVLAQLSPRLKSLSIQGFPYTGEIPEGLFACTRLEMLFMQDNKLTGALSPKIGDLKRLVRMQLWNTKLSGPPPKELGQLTSLSGNRCCHLWEPHTHRFYCDMGKWHVDKQEFASFDDALAKYIS